MSETRNIRSRYAKTISSDFILSTDNEKENDNRLLARKKHNYLQIYLMILMAIGYFLHSLRAYIPTTHSQFWTQLSIRPITRVYTSDLRPSIVVESLLLRLAENWQTFWLIYILSYIPRRTKPTYLSIFNSLFCLLLITALAFQTISQTTVSPQISCGCLYATLILLLIACRNLAVKFQLFKTHDFAIVRHFILNSLFLYMTSIVYLTICATVEYIGIYLDPNAISPLSTSICTTIGLLIVFIIIFIYFLIDRLIYENEFWSIWTPYLFFLYAFICPPLRQVSLLEHEIISNQFNSYLFWIVFSFILLILCLRIYQQIAIGYGKKIRINSNIEEISSGILQ